MKPHVQQTIADIRAVQQRLNELAAFLEDFGGAPHNSAPTDAPPAASDAATAPQVSPTKQMPGGRAPRSIPSARPAHQKGGGIVSAWRTCQPPEDGTVIVAIGRIIQHHGDTVCIRRFTAEVRWSIGVSGFWGWLYADDGMAVAHSLSEKVAIDHWLPSPQEEVPS